MQTSSYLNVFPHGAFDEELFTDLNDMEAHFQEVGKLLIRSVLAHQTTSTDSSVSFFATIDRYEPFYRSISFFELDDSQALKSLVTFTHVNDESDLGNRVIRYSMGYAVAPAWRGRGVGVAFVRQSLDKLQVFLRRIGPDRDGLFRGDDFQFVVDVVVEHDNTASKHLADRIRPNESEWETGTEKLSGAAASYYSIPLAPTPS